MSASSSFDIDTERAVNQPFSHPALSDAGLTADIKRLDLIHPEVSGNKWYKLKYNIHKVLESDHRTLLTFGGPWSNHIYATAAAGKLFGIKTIGIIRGEEPETKSNTLDFAQSCGMKLDYITRLAYAEKETEDFAGWLHEMHGDFHLVPEGGSNFLGINGCLEILTEEDKTNYDIICCACGTGATLAGIVMTATAHQTVLGFPALKNGSFLADSVYNHIRYFLGDEQAASELTQNVRMITDYHFGGYGKWTDELAAFIKYIESGYDLPLDQVYTGKMIYGLIDMASKKMLPANARILIIHTGGLQGRISMK